MTEVKRHNIEQCILAETASWMMLLQEGALSPQQQADFERWQHASAEHQRAWSRARRLLEQMERLPPALAKSTLARPAGLSRRSTLGALLLLCGGAPLGWLAWRSGNDVAADYLTAVGERRQLMLNDGSQVMLNTNTALDVRFDSQQRLLLLRRGEVHVSTAPDQHAPGRGFYLRTEQGLLQALGTEFRVRQENEHSILAVYQGAVRVRPEAGSGSSESLIVNAGQQVRFDRYRIGPVQTASDAERAWRMGLLQVNEMPLSEWARELMRYTRVTIHCAPELRGLAISGTFPLDDLPLALAMLERTHQLRSSKRGQQVLISR